MIDNQSVCPYLYTEGLSDKLENAFLISMQVRPDGLYRNLFVSSINRDNDILYLSVVFFSVHSGLMVYSSPVMLKISYVSFSYLKKNPLEYTRMHPASTNRLPFMREEELGLTLRFSPTALRSRS